MPQTLLAIDPGTYSLKIALATRAMGEFSLTHFYEIPLAGHELLTHEQALSALLRRFFEEHPLPYDTAMSSVSGLKSAFRVLDFPFNQLKKIDAAIEFELENYIPFSVEDLWIDYFLLEKQANHSKVLSIYTRKTDLKELLAAFNDGGIDPKYIGAEVLDLADLYYSGLLPPQSTYALIDLGHSKTNLCLMKGSELKGARTITLGGKRITQAIAKRFQISLEEAEKRKIEQGEVTPFETENELSLVIQEVLEELTIQIKQTLFAFYEEGVPKIEAVYLCGGTSKLSGIEPYLSAMLRVNVSLLQAIDPTRTKISNLASVQPILAPAIAQFYKTIYPKSIRTNFRTGEFAYKKDIQAISGHFKKTAILPVVILLLAVFYFGINYYTLKNREKRMKQNVSSILRQGMPGAKDRPASPTVETAISFVSLKTNESNDRIKKLEGSSSPSALEVFRLLSLNLPSRQEVKLDVDDLNISADRVRLDGRTQSYDALEKIKTSLERASQFKKVETSNVRKGVQEELKFTLSFDLVQGEK